MKGFSVNTIFVLITVLALIILPACVGDEAQSTSAALSSGTSTVSVSYDSDDMDSGSGGITTSYIELKGDSIALDGSGAIISGRKITITSGGTYSLSGTLYDGQIIVDTGDEETVRLILNGVDITCSNSAPVYVINAAKTVLTIADGTENYITDGDSYIFEDTASDEPNAAVFSHDDLTINGNGSLTIYAKYNNGIQSKDDLKIVSGNITVYSANDGIKGRDSVAIKGGEINVDAGADGIQSNNDEDSAEGYIVIEGGTINIIAGKDGIQAETSLIISGGSINISSGGGSAGNTLSADSAKGLKAGVDINMTGGIINIDSSDDSIHSNNSLTISGGDITLASGDDGIHSDSTLEINGGDINITKCYEGIESSAITINDGDIHLVASDDGINAVSGDGGSLMIGGLPGQGNFNTTGNNSLHINGGYIVVDAMGDGFDINGSITMTGGFVIINGPTSNADGALDYYNSFTMSGGFLIAVGSSGMTQAPDTTSTQYSVMMNLSSSQQAGTIIHIETEDGEEIITFVPTKAYQSVVLCSPELENNSTYIIYSGGSYAGTVNDGVYSGGTYTPGTQVTSFTVSSVVTNIGSPGGNFPGGGRTGPGGRP